MNLTKPEQLLWRDATSDLKLPTAAFQPRCTLKVARTRRKLITLCLRGSQPQALVNNQQGPPLANTNLSGCHSFTGRTCQLLHHCCSASNWAACFLFISKLTQRTYLKDFEKNEFVFVQDVAKGHQLCNTCLETPSGGGLDG